MRSNLNHITLYRSLFRGREDVFAVHWSKGKKSGYMPAYYYDPYLYRQHRMKGGTFKDFKSKRYEQFTDEQLVKHLKGERLTGVYPLLQDNTSWFIVADFDKENWFEQCMRFINVCDEYNIPAYLERSRSGNGGHVWVFFDQAYPAVKSRSIFITLLEKSGAFSVFDKTSSFDRLFPNQDYHSGKGLGNLIALPLYQMALDQGNSCFIKENLTPYEDQWKFLATIEKVRTTHLEEMYQNLIESHTEQPENTPSHSSTLQIKLNNVIRLNRSSLTLDLINFLKEELNFKNADYFIKKQIGKNIWGEQRYFRFIEESSDEVILPRGFVGKLLRHCKVKGVTFEFKDERKKLPLVNFTTSLELKEHQKQVLDITQTKDFGVITSPPGSGKTVIALKIIADKQQPALIVVHRKQLLDQWNERIEAFLGIPKRDIGKIGQGKAKLGKAITVAMIQSLGKFIARPEQKESLKAFGTIIIDECHHIPAETYRNAISKFNPYYQYGLTATPFRKGSDGKLIFAHLGDVIVEILPDQVENHKRAMIIVRRTQFDIPYNSKTDPFETLSKMLVHDSERNKLILGDVSGELDRGRKAVIITERKEHIEALNQFLKQSHETMTLSGEDKERSRLEKWKAINAGNYQVLITTGQFFGEGTDLQNASCLFLVYPFSFKGKLIQYIGRVQRSELNPIIYDYHDYKIDYLHGLFLKRNTYYRQLDKQASLFDDPDENPISSTKAFTLHKQIKVAIEDLDFRYGAIAFEYTIADRNVTLEFEVENEKMRPEFKVLKPFFSKFLKSKYVNVEISAEYDKLYLVAQLASSSDLESINQEIIDSVKFKFLEKNFFRKQYAEEIEQNLLNINQLQKGQDGTELYHSEDLLIDDLLKNKEFRHHSQLRYLSSKHQRSIMKLRFVLSPFSFVFLLSGEEQYHIVLETLDTEEATYIWHVDKNENLLKAKLKEVNLELTVIRNEGRQVFLTNDPANFSRIVHDYSDERKGFVIWKDMLEERLV